VTLFKLYFKENLLIIFILVFSVLIRFLPLTEYQFSHDELSAISRTIYPNLIQELNFAIKLDAHPALIQLFLWFWVKLFGYSEIAIKLPFLVCGVLSIWYVYKLGKTYLSEAAGIVTATILSGSFIFLVYSSYARMYMPGVLFSILLLDSVFKILFSESVNRKDYLLMVLWLVLCAYNHHMSSLFAATVFCLSLFYISKQRLKSFLLFGALAMLIYLPHLPITLYQFSIGGIGFEQGGWLSIPRAFEIYYFIKTLLGCGISGKLIMLLFFGLMVISVFKLNPISKKQFFLLWLFLINYAVIHLYSVFRSPILQFSVLLFSGVALILFLSSFASFLSKKQLTVFTLVIFTLLSFQTVRKKHFFSKVNIHAYDEQAQTILKMQRIAGKNNVAAVFGSEPFFVYAYQKKYHTTFNYLSVYDSIFINREKFTQYLKNLKQPYIVLCGIGAADVQHIKQYFPYLVSNKEDYFSNVTVLSKYDFGYYDVSILYNSGLLNSDVNVYLEPYKAITFQKDSFNYQINRRDKEYPFNLSMPLKRTLLENNQSLIAEISFVLQQDSLSSNDLINLSVSNEKSGTVFFKSARLKDFYNKDKTTQIAIIDLFAGTEFKKWLKEDMNVNFFIKKGKNSSYKLVNFKLKVTDYNPTRWTLWD